MTAAEPHPTPRAHRRREVVRRPDGTPVKIAKPPRADVLWYPGHRWVTVLVRRTHQLELARVLAEQRWAALGEEGPFVAHRVGWWSTAPAARDAPVPAAAAIDQLGRIVTWCPDASAPAAGPGIEFRP